MGTPGLCRHLHKGRICSIHGRAHHAWAMGRVLVVVYDTHAPGAVMICMWHTEKATDARHRLERQHNACAIRKKQCRPNETKPYSNATHPRKRPRAKDKIILGMVTPSRIKSTHTRLTYTGTRPHASGHARGPLRAVLGGGGAGGGGGKSRSGEGEGCG